MGEWIQLSQTINSNGVSATSDNIQLPRVRIDALLFEFEYTVTDAGISAGENFEGCIDKLEIGMGSAMFIELQRNELSKFIDFNDVGVSTGSYYDADPTTATLQKGYYMFPVAMRLQDVTDPRLYLSLRAITDEFGAASAFSLTGRVLLNVSDDQNGPGLVFKRTYRSTDTKHTLVTPQKPLIDIVTAVQIELGASNLDNIHFDRMDDNGKPILGSDAIDISTGLMGKFFYAAFKETAYSASTHRYIFGSFENPPGQCDVELDLSTTGTATCLAWVQGLKYATKPEGSK